MSTADRLISGLKELKSIETQFIITRDKRVKIESSSGKKSETIAKTFFPAIPELSTLQNFVISLSISVISSLLCSKLEI